MFCLGKSRAQRPSVTEAKVKRDTTAIISHFHWQRGGQLKGSKAEMEERVTRSQPWTRKKKLFTSSDPHHDMSGEGCQVNVYLPCETGISKRTNPPHLFSGILRALVVSCPPFSIAPVTSVCESKTQTCRRTSMPKHVSIPPGRNKHAKTCQNKHAKTWQWSAWTFFKIQTCQNMSVDPLSGVCEQTVQTQSITSPVRSVWANMTTSIAAHY